MLGKEGLVVFCRCCGVQGWPERCGWWRTPSCAAVKPEYPAAAAHCWLRHWSDRPRSPGTGWCRLWSPQGLSSCLVPKQRIQNKDTTSIKDIVCTTMKSLSSVTQLSAVWFSLFYRTQSLTSTVWTRNIYKYMILCSTRKRCSFLRCLWKIDSTTRNDFPN